MRIVFMGTPEFAVPCLQRLLDDGHEVVGVFTQPDKPKGRGYVLTPPPVKELAALHEIPVYQPRTLKDGQAYTDLALLQPELIVVVAYGKILPEAILQLPPKGCINVHASLLPKYRGAAPIQWSVLNGEKVTGVTTMYMAAGIDTGDMLKKEETPIGPDETAGELHDRLSVMGADLLSKTLAELASISPVPQNHQACTYAPMLDKKLSDINWNKSAQEVHNQIRGLSPWPTAMTWLEGKKMKIHRSKLSERADAPAGTVVSSTPLLVVCGDGRTVELTEVQFEGGKRMSAQDFVRGHQIPQGTLLKSKETE